MAPSAGGEPHDTLYDRVVAVLSEHGERELESYLLALYRLVGLHEDEPMTEELFFSLLAGGFTGEPAALDPGWLEAPSPPQLALPGVDAASPGGGAATSDEATSRSDPGVSSSGESPGALDAVAYTKAVLRFQIADLHLMRGGQLDDELRYFGIDSPSGHRWYNFDPQTLLECGATGLSDAGVDLSAISWALLGELLEVGRIYE